MSDHHTSKFTQGLNMPVLAIIAVVGTLVVWVTVVGVQAYYEVGVRAEEQTKLIQVDYLTTNKAAADLRAEQLANVAEDVIEPAKQAVINHYGGEKKPRPEKPAHSDPGHAGNH